MVSLTSTWTNFMTWDSEDLKCFVSIREEKQDIKKRVQNKHSFWFSSKTENYFLFNIKTRKGFLNVFIIFHLFLYRINLKVQCVLQILYSFPNAKGFLKQTLNNLTQTLFLPRNILHCLSIVCPN